MWRTMIPKSMKKNHQCNGKQKKEDGSTDRSHGPRSEWRPSSRSKVPAHTPPPKNQDEGRLQMLLEGALAAKSIQDTKTEDPKDWKYNQLLEEMCLAEGTFAHTLKDIELRDRRISSLEHYRTVSWHFSCYGAEKST